MSPSAFMQVEKVRGFGKSPSSDPDLGKPNSIEGPEPKASQEEAAYGGPEETCSTCEYFDGTSACSKVDGEIDPSGHSKFYKASNQAAPEIEEENEGEFGQ